jgi:hypothetical protein
MQCNYKKSRLASHRQLCLQNDAREKKKVKKERKKNSMYFEKEECLRIIHQLSPISSQQLH